MSEMQMFLPGEIVRILKYGKVIDIVQIICDRRSEIEVESLQANPGTHKEFAYIPDDHGWKLLVEGLGGERCWSERAPMYNILPF